MLYTILRHKLLKFTAGEYTTIVRQQLLANHGWQTLILVSG